MPDPPSVPPAFGIMFIINFVYSYSSNTVKEVFERVEK